MERREFESRIADALISKGQGSVTLDQLREVIDKFETVYGSAAITSIQTLGQFTDARDLVLQLLETDRNGTVN